MPDPLYAPDTPSVTPPPGGGCSTAWSTPCFPPCASAAVGAARGRGPLEPLRRVAGRLSFPCRGRPARSAPGLSPPTPSPSDYRCGACRQDPPAFDRLLALWSYQPPLDSVIQGLKFRRLDYLGRHLAWRWPKGCGTGSPASIGSFPCRCTGAGGSRAVTTRRNGSPAPSRHASTFPTCRPSPAAAPRRPQSRLGRDERLVQPPRGFQGSPARARPGPPPSAGRRRGHDRSDPGRRRASPQGRRSSGRNRPGGRADAAGAGHETVAGKRLRSEPLAA